MSKPKRNLEATNTPPESPVSTTTVEDPFGSSPIPNEAGPDPLDEISPRAPFGDAPDPDITEPLPPEPVPGVQIGRIHRAWWDDEQQIVIGEAGIDDPAILDGFTLATAHQSDWLMEVGEIDGSVYSRREVRRNLVNNVMFQPATRTALGRYHLPAPFTDEADGGRVIPVVLAVPGVVNIRGDSFYTPPSVLSDPEFLTGLIGVPVFYEPREGEDPGFDDQPDEEESLTGDDLAAQLEADRVAAIDATVAGANDRLFATRPPPQILSFSPVSIDLDATLKAPWSNGALPGWATVKINLKARITSASQAADLEEHLPGAGFVFRCGTPPEGSEPRDMHLHWTPAEDLLDWSIVQMGEIVPADHDLHARIKGQAAVKSLTLTSSSGTVMLSIGVHIEVQVGALSDVDALNGQPVRVKARLAQGKLT